MKSKLLLALVNVLVLCALILAIMRLADLYFEVDIQYQFSFSNVFLIISLQTLLLISSAYAWTQLLKRTTLSKMPLRGGIEQVGFMLVGKYLPGKVGGIMVRAITADKYQIESGKVIEASFVELFIVLYIAFTAGLSIYVWMWNPLLSILLLFGFFVFGHLAFIFFVRVLSKLSTKIRQYLNKVNAVDALQALSFKEFIRSSFLYGLPWLFTALIFVVLLEMVSINLQWQQVIVFMGAYMVAVGIGFLAVFAPGGIGVREAVFVALVADFIDVGVALQLALVIRVWSTLYDVYAVGLGFGCHSYDLYMGKK